MVLSILDSQLSVLLDEPEAACLGSEISRAAEKAER